MPALLLLAFAGVLIALGIAPRYRQDWMLENLLVVAAIPLLAWLHRRAPLRNASYACLFAFGVLHEIGAHYTYSEVPYDQWFQALSGHSLQELLGLQRNHYDRAIHFLYGLLVTPAVMEVLQRWSAPIGAWRWLLPISFISLHAVVYELLEWGAARALGGPLGDAYLGAQGDSWDAQQDMALALLGSAISAAVVLWRGAARVRRDSVMTPLAAAIQQK